MDSFAVHHFAFDGEHLGSQTMESSLLSSKWLSVCTDLIESHGPVFSQTMGGTLDRYEIKCTAGICHFRVRGEESLYAAIIPNGPESQCAALLATYANQLRATSLVTENCRDLVAFINRLESTTERPALVIVNWLNPVVQEQDSHAVFQLALHFARAYLRWLPLTE